MPETLRLGTRGSPSRSGRRARWSAGSSAARPGLRIEREILKTPGDRVQDEALFRIGDKGLFTKDVEAALAGGTDRLRRAQPQGPAHDPRAGTRPRSRARARGSARRARVARARGCTSCRRGRAWARPRCAGAAQLLALRPDLRIVELRGNVSTRLAKAERGECEALVLARAGLLRLGLESRAVEVFEPERILPAVGQGVVAVEVREGDARARDLASAIDHTATRLAVTAERALLARLEGGCQVPIGALAVCAGGRAPPRRPRRRPRRTSRRSGRGSRRG